MLLKKKTYMKWCDATTGSSSHTQTDLWKMNEDEKGAQKSISALIISLANWKWEKKKYWLSLSKPYCEKFFVVESVVHVWESDFFSSSVTTQRTPTFKKCFNYLDLSLNPLSWTEKKPLNAFPLQLGALCSKTKSRTTARYYHFVVM